MDKSLLRLFLSVALILALCGCRNAADTASSLSTSAPPPTMSSAVASLPPSTGASVAASGTESPPPSPSSSASASTNAVVTTMETPDYSSKYAGTWKTPYSDGCIRCKTFMKLKFSSVNRASVSITQQSSGGGHVAGIDFETTFDERGIGSFTFDEDGWFHQGKGTITLKLATIDVDITEVKDNVESNGEASSYNIFSGIQTFYGEDFFIQEVLSKLNDRLGTNSIEYVGSNGNGLLGFCYKVDPESDGEPLCYDVNSDTGKYCESISGGYEGNVYHEYPVYDPKTVTQYIKEKLKLSTEIQDDGFDDGNYIAYTPSDGNEYEYDSETGDLFDGHTGEKVDNIGVIKDAD